MRWETNTVLGVENGALGSSTSKAHVALNGAVIAVTPDQCATAINAASIAPMRSDGPANSEEVGVEVAMGYRATATAGKSSSGAATWLK